jgi:F0F1-type ATP synthase membrane subunit b/b'
MLEFMGVVLAFLLLVGIVLFTVRGLFARETTQALSRVRQREEELQAKATVLEQRLAQLEHDHRQKLKHADAEAERIVQEAKQQAMNIRTASVEEAKHRARQLVMEADQTRQHATQTVTHELSDRAVAWTITALRMLLTPEEQQHVHARLLQQLITVCAQVELGAINGHVERVQVRSAQPLDAAQTDALRACLATKFNHPVTLDATTDPTLMAGGVVSLGEMVVDGTVHHYVTRLVQTT